MSEIGIKDQCFGVEVEMTGITREQAAQTLAEYFGTSPQYIGGVYDAWSVTDPEGKTWKLMSDASIQPERRTAAGYVETDDRHYKVEMVTPKLTYAELPKLQECVRQVRHAGAKANSSCGIHRPCGRRQPQPAESEKSHRHHVLQGGYFVQGFAGKRGQGGPLV